MSNQGSIISEGVTMERCLERASKGMQLSAPMVQVVDLWSWIGLLIRFGDVSTSILSDFDHFVVQFFLHVAIFFFDGPYFLLTQLLKDVHFFSILPFERF